MSDYLPGATVLEPEPTRRPIARRFLFGAVNLWLIWHLMAIIIAPASVSPSSELVQATWNVFRPYLQALYLNHGYHFFAPEPDKSTLLAYVAERADGTVVRGRIPNFSIQPRLLYHRHFMLTEQMTIAPPELEGRWYASYAQHLGRAHGAVRVGLTRQTHFLPTMEMVRQGVRLDDPASFEEQPLGVFRCDAY